MTRDIGIANQDGHPLSYFDQSDQAEIMIVIIKTWIAEKRGSVVRPENWTHC